MKYTNCPTCGALCKYIPQPPKEAVRIDAVEDFEKQRILLEASKVVDTRLNSLREILDFIPLDELFVYVKERIRWPKGKPISWSDLNL